MTDIKDYIHSQTPEVQEILNRIYEIIKKVVPNSTEGISYGVPTIYINNKYFIYFAGYKNHISIYPAVEETVNKVKGLDKYKVSKGTLKFLLKDPIPYDMIEEFVVRKYKDEYS